MPELPLLWVTCALPLQETLGRVVGSGLPALLLQCLYLFFVFPVEKDELLESDVQGQRIFVQVSEQGPGLPMLLAYLAGARLLAVHEGDFCLSQL